MGDWFQTIVDKDASPWNSKALAADILDWLISVGVVVAERDDCVLGAESGHRPGPAADTVVDSTGWSSSFHTLLTNGLAIVTERCVFNSGQGMPTAVTCPRCDSATALVDDFYEPIPGIWEMFVDEGAFAWAAGRDMLTVPCPICAEQVDLADWTWADDYFALGYLGFTFWNWPPFRPDFIAEFGRRLGGHRTALVEGKL
ncbi:hypothetical protein [Nocardia carnea]|uniref:hypothetical protein n=1 Tax=Nocardia carnea TaxID=37328 RepID=UPI0024574E7A|nr:hypothetical protein [Nocardia carnea]